MSGKAHREAILRACVGKSAGPHPDGPHPLFHRSRCGQADSPPWDFHFIGPHPSGGRGYVPASGQAGCRDAPRVQKKQLGFPDAQDAAPVHHRRFFTHMIGLIVVVRHQQNISVKGVQQFLHLDLQLIPQMFVQRGEGLVQHQKLRPAHQYAGQRRPLLLPTRELVRPLLLEPLQVQ